MESVYDTIRSTLHVPSVHLYRKKFLVNQNKIEIPSEIEQEVFEDSLIYLITFRKKYQVWVRKRVYESGTIIYSYCERKIAKMESERLQLTRQISKSVYESYFKQKNPNLKNIKKKITSFIWNNHVYHLETFIIDENQSSFLRVSSNDEKVEIPPFFENLEDVSENPKYFTIRMAHI